MTKCWTSVEDIVPTLYKYYTNVLCLLGHRPASTNPWRDTHQKWLQTPHIQRYSELCAVTDQQCAMVIQPCGNACSI